VFVVVSQLSGSNGEWTGSDDVPGRGRGGGVRDDKRMPPVSQVGDRQTSLSGLDAGLSQLEGVEPGVGKNKTKNKNKQPNPDTAQFDPVVVEQQESITFVFIRNPTEGGWYTDGASRFDKPPGGFEVRPCEEPFLCKNFGLGWAEISSINDKNKRLTPALPASSPLVIEAAFVSATNPPISWPRTTYMVFWPLFKMLSTRLRGVTLTEHVANSAMALARADGYVVGVMMSDTIQAFLHATAAERHKVLDSRLFRQITTNNGSAIGWDEFGTVVSLGVGGSVNYGQVWAEPPATERFEWCGVRHDFDIVGVSSSGVEYTAEGVPQFVVVEPRNLMARNWFFRFLHPDPDKNFRRLSNSGMSLNGGLSRLLKERPEESSYRRGAIWFGYHLFVVIRSTQERLTLEGIHRYDLDWLDSVWALVLGKRVVPNRRVDLSQWDWFQTIWGTLLPMLVIFLSSCDVSAVQRFSDICQTNTSWIYHSAWRTLASYVGATVYRPLLADLPSLKREERRRYVNGQVVHVDDDPIIRKVDVKVKDEFAKYKKAARLYVGTAEGVIAAPHLAEFGKKAIDGSHYFTSSCGLTLQVVILGVVRSDSVVKAFEQLWLTTSTVGHMMVLIFSDDSVYAANIGGEAHLYNVDISSNDSSQDAPAFLVTSLLCEHFGKDAVLAILRQLDAPMFVKNPSDFDAWFKLKFHALFQGSGSSWTTILNHVGSFLIALSVFSHVVHGCEFRASIIRGAAFIGHVVTIEDTELQLERMQFLKRSPYVLNGVFISVINQGCILRGLGGYTGDLTPVQLGVSAWEFQQMSMTTRMERFCGAIVAGYKNEPNTPILAALRKRFLFSGHVIQPNSVFYHECGTMSDVSEYVVGWEYMTFRYGLSEEDCAPLINAILSLRLGDAIVSDAFARIMCVDYGVA